MSAKCYFCLNVESKISVPYFGSFHICPDCVPLLKATRENPKDWESIKNKSDAPEKFETMFDEALKNHYDEPIWTTTEEKEKVQEKIEVQKPKTPSSNGKKVILKDLAIRLKDKVKDQDHVIDEMVPKVLVYNLGIEKTKPLSFVFSGPTGVGKTELASQLAKQLNVDFCKFDMSEYKLSHSVSRLLGSPPSYVGYGKATPLEKVSGKKCVILFDEIEKAHIEISDALLQVLDKGCLTTGSGKELDLKEAIIIFTSNLGVSEHKDSKHSIGLIKSSDENAKLERNEVFQKAIRSYFRPEMVNRLDNIFCFNPISEEGLAGILAKNLAELNDKFGKAHNVTVELSPSVTAKILKDGFSKEEGARPLRRTLEAQVLTLVAEKVLMEEQENCVFKLDLEKDQVKIVEVVPLDHSA